VTFYILCGINSKDSDILKKWGGWVHIKNYHQIICHSNDDTISFCYKSLITILVVMMMMRRRRWTVMMIWNIY
jgi:hypothetical protein